MNKFINRPEAPNLDHSQLKDLEEFLSNRTPEQLAQDKSQLITDSTKDQGPYSSEGVPANVNKSLIIINDLLEIGESTRK